MIKVSIVIPLYNEAPNIKALLETLQSVISNNKQYKMEILLINDGSTDSTEQELKKHLKTTAFKLINFTRNFGQTAALSAGFDLATGDIIIALDGDLQNNPGDIPKLLEKIEEGYDVVSGWRKNRKDNIIRIIPSQLANILISWISGVSLHDFGCTLKAYRKSFIQDLKLYGEMHRFIPIYAYWQGAKITEIVVSHQERKFGKSNYGMIRILKVILDLITIKFLGSYSTKPIYFFGSIGVFLSFLSLIAFSISVYEKLFLSIWIHRNPLFSIAIFLMLAAIQFLFFGILAEITIRTYHESCNKKTYRIKN